MLVDDRTVAAVVLVEGNAVDRRAQQLCEGRFPLLYRRPPQVVAVELERSKAQRTTSSPPQRRYPSTTRAALSQLLALLA